MSPGVSDQSGAGQRTAAPYGIVGIARKFAHAHHFADANAGGTALQGITHQCGSGRNQTAEVLAALVDHVQGQRGAGVGHQEGALDLRACACHRQKAVAAKRVRLIVGAADAEGFLGGNEELRRAVEMTRYGVHQRRGERQRGRGNPRGLHGAGCRKDGRQIAESAGAVGDRLARAERAIEVQRPFQATVSQVEQEFRGHAACVTLGGGC